MADSPVNPGMIPIRIDFPQYLELTPRQLDVVVEHAPHIVLSWMFYFRAHQRIPAGIKLYTHSDDERERGFCGQRSQILVTSLGGVVRMRRWEKHDGDDVSSSIEAWSTGNRIVKCNKVDHNLCS